jgi:PAS domain S-box-containing protein
MSSHEQKTLEIETADRIFSFSMVPVAGASYVNCYGRDITIRKQAEEALRLSEEKYRTIVETANEGIWEIDAKGKTSYCNGRMAQMLGRTIDEMLGKEFSEFMDDDGRQRAQATFEKRKQGVVGSFEQNFLRKDGATVWLISNGTPLHDKAGNFAGSLGMFTDITERKRAEEAQQAAHERITAVLNNIADTFYSLDRQWRFMAVNPAAEKAPFGRPASELLGKVIWEIFPGLVGTPIQRHYLDAAEKKSLEHYEAQSPLNRRWYDVFMQGHAGGVDVYMRDITDRKKAEEALRESEAQLSAVFNSISETLMLLDLSGVILAANDLAARRLNKSAGDFVGKNLFDLIPAHFHKTRKEQIATLVRTKKPIKFEDRLADTYLDLTFYPVFDKNGDVIQFVSFALDVTELKARQRDLDKLNRTLRALSKSSQAMLRARNEQEFMQSVCSIILEDCGYKMIWIGMAENDPEKSVRPIESCGFEDGYLETLKITWADTERGHGPTGTSIRTGSVSICKNMLTDPAFEPWRKEALARGYASSIALPLMEDGTAFGALMIYSEKPDPFIDEEVKMLTELASDLAHGITVLWLRQAREKMEDQLAARARELAAANKDLESFAYSVSHDLRAPLRAMHSFSGMLMEDYHDKLDETGRDYLNRIGAGATKMSALIDDIMSLSQISRQEMEPGEVNLSEIVAGILHDLQQSQPQRMVEIVIAPGVRTSADARLIRVALTNLLQNAWKYTGKKEHARIEFGLKQSPKGIAYFVRDNGAGFDMRHASRLFAAFVRLHAEKDFSGTGIGLAIVNRVIARHGGKVWAESKPDEGACFWFSLPLHAQQSPATLPGGER